MIDTDCFKGPLAMWAPNGNIWIGLCKPRRADLGEGESFPSLGPGQVWGLCYGYSKAELTCRRDVDDVTG